MAKKSKKFANLEGKQFHPHGQMCMVCEKLYQDCSGLNFTEMRPVVDVDDHNAYVRCKELSKAEKPYKYMSLYKKGDYGTVFVGDF